MLFDGKVDVVSLRHSNDLTLKGITVEVKPLGHRLGAVCFDDCLELFAGAALVLKCDNVANLNTHGGDACLLTIDGEVVVTNKLTSFGTAHCKTKTVNNVVQTELKELEQVFTRLTLHLGSLLKIVGELLLKNAVVALSLLLFTSLQTVLALLLAALAVLTRSIFAAGKCAFASVASVALEEQFLTLTTAQLTNSTGISCHIRTPPN